MSIISSSRGQLKGATDGAPGTWMVDELIMPGTWMAEYLAGTRMVEHFTIWRFNCSWKKDFCSISSRQVCFVRSNLDSEQIVS